MKLTLWTTVARVINAAKVHRYACAHRGGRRRALGHHSGRGCSGDDDEPSSLPDATTAGSAVTPTDTGSTPPADPTAQLEAEITDFYKLYVETINESWTSEQALQRRREMFADTCATCAAGYELTKGALEEGLTLEAEPARVRSARLDNFDGDVVTFLGIEDVLLDVCSIQGRALPSEFDATLAAQVVYRASAKAMAGSLLQVTSLSWKGADSMKRYAIRTCRCDLVILHAV